MPVIWIFLSLYLTLKFASTLIPNKKIAVKVILLLILLPVVLVLWTSLYVFFLPLAMAGFVYFAYKKELHLSF
jgi:hypothetical protein